ncbi:hypothetical protein JTE90_005699 [Oedothorax gibbosus]|uniref:Uncharacterized protein n=1 Tax=Oedothorax gibbosus TaxID=931172 RepID=A0AAV6UH32_9ARAC|nr:hypothetical protein JTE90_005699 [Oedothorax gibbosus]
MALKDENTYGEKKNIVFGGVNETKRKVRIEREKSAKKKVTCPQSYFVGEVSWCPESQLREGAREVTLQVCTLEAPPEKSSAEPNLPESPNKDCDLSPEIISKMESGPFVLDIDLDFYSTRNPFLSIFTPEQFELLRKLYHYEHPTELTDEVRDFTINFIK